MNVLLVGEAASKGIHKGKVKICETGEEAMRTIEDGDVLVTSMTDPDFVPAMKKARAFVTDNGGLTCHAAIIARELKKPCVVGTHDATTILHEAQEVTVDGGEGAVYG